MTTTTDRTSRAHGASPVDFDTYGDYGDFRPKGGQQEQKAEFVRAAYPFKGRITADGSSGHQAEAGRYHLYISWACPWAQRTAIVRKLLGLESVISLSVVDPVRDGRGWAFREGAGHDLDTVNGFAFLREAYEATEPGYGGHISVPVLWDKQTGQIVSNNFPDITIDMETEFGSWADPAVQLYPAELRPQLDDLEQRLENRRYLLGASVTEADVRLWVTLARFDVVYYSHFKTNLRRIADYPNLWAYARDLYAIPAFRETTNFDHIKRHYYVTHGRLNPTRIVPDGPLLDWEAPHGRQA